MPSEGTSRSAPSRPARLADLLWVPAGADRVAALEELRASGKITADVPAYCAEWKHPNGRWRDRVLGPRPRSRLTNQRHISDEEVAVLEKAICHDLESSGFSSNSSASDDVRDQQLNEMTDRELIGVILKSWNNNVGINF